MKNKRQISLIMDDGGGIVLVVHNDKYTHYYDYASQLAMDLEALMAGDACARWDNNEWGSGIDGIDSSCRVYTGTAHQVIAAITRDYRKDNSYGANHNNLARALINL